MLRQTLWLQGGVLMCSRLTVVLTRTHVVDLDPSSVSFFTKTGLACKSSACLKCHWLLSIRKADRRSCEGLRCFKVGDLNRYLLNSVAYWLHILTKILFNFGLANGLRTSSHYLDQYWLIVIGVISQEVVKIFVLDMSLTISSFKLQWHHTKADNLNRKSAIWTPVHILLARHIHFVSNVIWTTRTSAMSSRWFWRLSSASQRSKRT